jgi:hypothetical protein
MQTTGSRPKSNSIFGHIAKEVLNQLQHQALAMRFPLFKTRQ